MADLVKYDVTREHLGDDVVDGADGPTIVAKRFAAGDTRTADPTVVAHLVKLGVLVNGKKVEADAPAPVEAPTSAAVSTVKPAVVPTRTVGSVPAAKPKAKAKAEPKLQNKAEPALTNKADETAAPKE